MTILSAKKKSSKACPHDHKNAIQVGNIDYVCPLCNELLDPLEWFLMNSFSFVDVEGEIIEKKKVVTGKNVLSSKSTKRLG